MELVERLPSGEFGFATFSLGVLQALRPASELTSDSHRWVSNASAGAPAVIVDMSDQWALDRLAHEAACAGARILGRAEASGMWAGYVFHPMWAMAARVIRRVADDEASEVLLGRRSMTQSVVVSRAVFVAPLVPSIDGTFDELTLEDGRGEIAAVSASAALRASGRPAVRSGAGAWRPTAGFRRADSDVRRVLEALVYPDPDDTHQPWALVRGSLSGRAEAVLVSRRIRRHASRLLIRRGVPALHAWRACYLAVDGDSPLSVEATLDVCTAGGLPLVAAYSGSVDADGFRHLVLVVLVDPADRVVVAEAIHDRMHELAVERGLRGAERHAARPHEMSRLPCTASVKAGTAPGYAFVRVISQPVTGPTVVEPIAADLVAGLLRIDDAESIPAAPAAAEAVHRAPATRPVGVDAAWWVAGMDTDVRWHLNADLEALGTLYRHADGTPSSSEAAWRALSSMRARGATALDIFDVLGAGGAGVVGYLRSYGKQPESQLRQIEKEVARYDRKAGTTTPGQGTGRHWDLAEAAWQSLPTSIGWAQTNALAALLDVVARVGRLDDATGEIRVDLGARALAEIAGAAWATLTAAVAQLPWLDLDSERLGGRDGTGLRQQTTWVVRARLVDVPDEPVRPPLRQYVATLLRTHLVHARALPGQAAAILLTVQDQTRTRGELRAAHGLTPQRLSQVLRPLIAAGLVVADRSTVTRGPVSPAAAAVALGAVERYEEVVEIHLGERENDDARIERNARPSGERKREHAIKCRQAREMAWAIAGMVLEDTAVDWDPDREPPADYYLLDPVPTVPSPSVTTVRGEPDDDSQAAPGAPRALLAAPLDAPIAIESVAATGDDLYAPDGDAWSIADEFPIDLVPAAPATHATPEAPVVLDGLAGWWGTVTGQPDLTARVAQQVTHWGGRGVPADEIRAAVIAAAAGGAAILDLAAPVVVAVAA